MALAKADIEHLQLGLSTLQAGLANYAVPNAHSGEHDDPKLVRELLIEQCIAADTFGVDSFSVSAEFANDSAQISTPELVAEIAEKTSQIHLVSAGCNVVNDDPSYIFSKFTEIAQHHPQRIELSLAHDHFNHELAMKAQSSGLRVWLDDNGNNNAILQAAQHQIPLQLQIFDADPMTHKPFVDLYYSANSRFNHSNLPLSVQVMGFVTETEQEAIDLGVKHWAARFPADTPLAEIEADLRAHITGDRLCVGTPDQVAHQIARLVEHFGLSRFVMRYPCAIEERDALLRHVELFGKEVIPHVRELLADTNSCE